jgi:hypothetical protein
MAARQQTESEAKAGECRKCRTFCDKLVEPRGCLALRCQYLYSYRDELSGNRYLGCMQKVFKAEIDMDAFELAELSGEGFGGLKMTGQPLPQCQFTVEPAYEGGGPRHECVNPRFFDCDEGPNGMRVFDLRDAIA